jgi:integrase
MLRWATTKRLANGERWLRDNPLIGVRQQRETSPLRPVATRERFEATRVAMHRLAAEAGTERLRRGWLVAELALVLAEGTGRRIGSIEKLRWEDLDWAAQTIRWHAEFDKKRREAVVPYPDRLFEEIRQLRRAIGAIGEWVLPHPRRLHESVGTHMMAMPLPDVAMAGGWKDVQTLLTCYQHPDGKRSSGSPHKSDGSKM